MADAEPQTFRRSTRDPGVLQRRMRDWVATRLPEGANPADAVSALTNLGYDHAHASAAIASVVRQSDENTRTEELIRLGLKELVR